MARQTRAGAAQTRARVIEAATEVFSERGLGGGPRGGGGAGGGGGGGGGVRLFWGLPLVVGGLNVGLRGPR
ncbi:TetR family transcriptional regulator, partial [Ralstonia solanacearum]|nr:TetR family transcriptional regulator [Ralstonia solanacearum]